jgi:hypothetical protein
VRVEVSEGGAKLDTRGIVTLWKLALSDHTMSHMPNTSTLGPINDNVWSCMISGLSTTGQLHLQTFENRPLIHAFLREGSRDCATGIRRCVF